MVQKSRRIPSPFISITGVKITEPIYCRKCMEEKSYKDFYQAVDMRLDSNGFMSICKTCCYEIYDGAILTEKTLNRALLKACRILNVQYSEAAVDAVRKEMATDEEKGRAQKSVFSMYRSKLSSTESRGDKMESATKHDLTFQEPRNLEPSEEDLEIMSNDEFWGDHLPIDDVEFLETEYRNFKQTHVADTYAEQVLLKLVCYKLLDIKKGRTDSKSTSSEEKELQGLMKNLAISPDMIKAGDVGKTKNTLGERIAEIEENMPADFFADKKIYHDVDNIQGYFESFFVRPLRNFVTGHPDFNLVDDEKSE